MSAIGAVLRGAVETAAVLEYVADQGCDNSEDHYAAYEGRAYGLAFRAAELAYDLGQRHERARIVRKLRDDRSIGQCWDDDAYAAAHELADALEAGAQ